MNNTPEPGSRRCCRRIIFYGRVQGVGFRYTAASAARTCRVNGYVRNGPDGTVELLADGRIDDVERLVKGLREKFAGNIERQSAEEILLSEPLDGFEIRH